MADYSQFFPSGGESKPADYSEFFPQAPARIVGPHQNISQQQQLEEDKRLYSPTVGMSGLDRFTAGAQKFLGDKVLGVEQLISDLAPIPIGTPTNRPSIQQRIDERKALDAPLMSTPGGMAGNVVGGAVMTAPMMGIPGANTIPGAMLLGGVQGATDPVASGGSRAKNMLIDMAAGGAGQLAGMGLNSLGTNRITNLANQQGQNAVRDATLQASRDAGYVLPPSAVQPGFFTNRLESVAGKAALGQEASHRNQEVTNQLVRQELGIPTNQAISETALETIRKAEGKAYSEVAALNKNAADALEELGKARFESKTQWNYYNKSGNPEALAKAKQADADKVVWEKMLEQEALAAGKPDLVTRLREARARIAKTYSVDRALNINTGDVDAKLLARQLDQGLPLTGGLETVARFAGAFPRYAVEGAPAAGVSKLESGAAAGLGLLGGSTLGPWGTAMAALPLLSPAARSGILSTPGQALLSGVPNYNPGILTRGLASPALPGLLGIGAPQLGILAGQ